MYLTNMRKTCCDVRYKSIFTDIQMPVMDGITEVQLILQHQEQLRRENPSLPKQVITFVSSYEQSQNAEKLRNLDFDHYLCKPVTERNIKEILTPVFGGQI